MRKGMTPELVEKHAALLEEAATGVLRITEGARQSVAGIDWLGSDRETYLAQLETHLGENGPKAAQALQALVQKARQNAQQQRQASA
ncbi:hypothetical protein ACUH9Y_07080 [Dermabacteraceae bacterium P13115]